MQFCHIAPTAYIEPLKLTKYKTHLLLAHLVESDPKYAKIYADMAFRRDEFTGTHRDKTYILDNSAFELYRAGLPMFDPQKLVELAKQVKADYIVLPDYPGEGGKKTIDAALEYIPVFKNAGFGTFFVPQSQIGDTEDFISTFAWAASHPGIDYIGMSILGIPNAFGVDGNDIQRFTSRLHMFDLLEDRGLIQLAKANGKKIHCLGMTDGPNEVSLLGGHIAEGIIDTWDSSSAVWAGIEGVKYDSSPTGLINGKVKSHVDFNRPYDASNIETIQYNMKVIDQHVETFSNND